MGENTKIEWATHTFNPWMGCTKVASGCTHCYAEAFTKRYGKAEWGPNGTRVKTSDANWRKPLKWNREAQGAAERPRVFCASLADVFEDWKSEVRDSHGNVLVRADWAAGVERRITLDDVRYELFALIDATPWLDWLLLTKRPENVQGMWPDARRMPAGDPFAMNGYRPNVWLLTSIAMQADADENVPKLLACGDLVPVLGLSIEPMLGPIDIASAVVKRRLGDPQPNWVIAGGESGPGARPCNIAWIRSIIEQCRAADVSCFVKQLGSNCVVDRADDVGSDIHCLLKKTLRDKKGGDPDEWPEDLRVREFPRTATAKV